MNKLATLETLRTGGHMGAVAVNPNNPNLSVLVAELTADKVQHVVTPDGQVVIPEAHVFDVARYLDERGWDAREVRS